MCSVGHIVSQSSGLVHVVQSKIRCVLHGKSALPLALSALISARCFTLNISMAWVIWPGFFGAFFLSLIATPLFTLAFTILKKPACRGFRYFNMTMMSGFINLFNPALHQYLVTAGMTQDSSTWQIMGNVVLHSQANMRGMLDAFVLLFYGFFIMIPLILFLKKPRLK